jgi:superfamily II DNA or RNA helicase
VAFRNVTQGPAPQNDPESLFRDLRSRKVQGLMSQQADMLRSYMGEHTESDVALELPTGSGKTLVGLLIAEWRRLKFRERCMVLCPTKQLVHQVVEQAKGKYGIDIVGFVGSKKTYNPTDLARYTAGQVIAVTNYSSLLILGHRFPTTEP